MKEQLFKDYVPLHTHLVCIDSDGCAFDTMEIKHKECFCPATVHAWNLQPISKYVRDAWDYGNLYSKTRGFSRFHELCLVFDLLADRAEVKASGFQLPNIDSFRAWVRTAPLLNNDCLEKAGDASGDPVLRQALRWSLEMNARAADMVHGIPPFPGVRESLQRLAPQCDIVIVSATPREALEREWAEHDLMQYVRLLCAQETGTKKQCIRALAPHYAPAHVLMIGDAPGDLDAAHAGDALFYPIRPGEEMDSWQSFVKEDLLLFLSGAYAGAQEQARIRRFDACLPDVPPWKK